MDKFLPTPFIIFFLALVFIGVPLFFVVLYRAERKAAAQPDKLLTTMTSPSQSVEAQKEIPLGVCPQCGKETYHEVDRAQDALSSLPGAGSTLPEGSVVFRCSSCGYTYAFQESQYYTGKEINRRNRMGCASELKWWLIGFGVFGILAAINFLIRGGGGEDPLEQLKQPVNVEPLAAAVFSDDIDLDLLGSGTVVAFRKGDRRLSYTDAAVIYDFYAGNRSSKREGLIVLIVRRYDTRELAATLFDSHCARDKYATQEPVPVAITQFDGGRACVSDVQATSYNDAGSPDAYEAYLVVQKNTLVIELYQRSCDIPDSTLREDVAEFLAEHLPDLAQQLDRVASGPWEEPILPATPSRPGYAAPAVSYTSEIYQMVTETDDLVIALAR